MNNHIAIGMIVFMVIALFTCRIWRPWVEKEINVVRPRKGVTDPSAWTIGPVIPLQSGGTENSSKNMPLHPAQVADGLLLDMPTPQSEPHYVTFNHGPLAKNSKITLKVRLDIEAGGQFFAKDGVSQASMCLYFQRQFDDFDATVGNPTGAMITNVNTQYYRWFATPTALIPLVAGTFTLTANLADKWTSLRAESEDSLNPHDGAKWFKGAVDDATEVGFVLGGGDGWGHGIIATKPAKITILSFEVA